MLRFTRGIHTSRCLLQEISTSASEKITLPELIVKSREHFQAYLRFTKASKGMRLLMYRPKHAQELLARDLIDPLTNKRAKPTKIPNPPSPRELIFVLRNAENQDELNQFTKDLTPFITRAPTVLTPYLLNELGIKNAEFGYVGSYYSWLFSKSNLKSFSHVDNLNLYLVYLYLNPNKSYTNVLNKYGNIKIKTKEHNLITDLLFCSIKSKFGQTDITDEVLQRIKTENIDLPLNAFNKSIGKQADLHNKKDHLFATLKPIAIELGNHEQFKSLENVQKIVSFVEQYEALTIKLNKTNRFEEIKAKTVFHTSKKSKAETPEVEAEAEAEATNDA